jgi:hypothetical protein
MRRARGDGPARPQLRDRRRGRLDPDRRGADAADHLGAEPGPVGPLHVHRQGDPEISRRALHARREAAHATFTDEGNDFLEDKLHERAAARGAEPLRPRKHHHRPPREPTLRAHKLFTKDKDYIVRGGEVVLIDEFTGRMMPGRRLSTVCTRRSRPRKAARSSPRTSPWRASRSRTTSASTTSLPA